MSVGRQDKQDAKCQGYWLMGQDARPKIRCVLSWSCSFVCDGAEEEPCVGGLDEMCAEVVFYHPPSSSESAPAYFGTRLSCSSSKSSSVQLSSFSANLRCFRETMC